MMLDPTPRADHGSADDASADALVQLLYIELRVIARRERRRLQACATLCTTALVSEAWLRLQRSAAWRGHRHFLATAALAMRQVLVNDALARGARKRNDGQAALSLDEQLDAPDDAHDERVLLVNDAVDRLARLSPRLAQVVECRFFAGYTDEQTAEALGVTDRTVRRDWLKARAWLYRELGDERRSPGAHDESL